MLEDKKMTFFIWKNFLWDLSNNLNILANFNYQNGCFHWVTCQ